MDALRKIFMQSRGHYIAAGILTVLIGIFRYCTLPAEVGIRWACYEICSVSGFAVFLIGGLMLAAYFGAFDLFGFVFSPGKNSTEKKFKNYADYAKHQEEKRARQGYFFVPYFVVGALVELISVFFA